jgi:hypothetical protein
MAGLGNAFDEAKLGNRHNGKSVLRNGLPGKERWISRKKETHAAECGVDGKKTRL